jgi:serine/threonine protein phosphatase PrpC
MGNLLGSPVTTKETHYGSTIGMSFAVSTMQGWRVHMEDAHIAEPRLYAVVVDDCDDETNMTTNTSSSSSSTTTSIIELEGHSLYAVFDGHGGTFAAMYSGRNLLRVLSHQSKFGEYARFHQQRVEKEKAFTNLDERDIYIQSGLRLLTDALADSFVAMDKEIACALQGQKVTHADEPYHGDDPAASSSSWHTNGGGAVVDTESAATEAAAALRLLQEEEGSAGTTACVILITDEWIVCANAGDSRAVLAKLPGRVIPLSYDHKPDEEQEERRIRAAGGYVAGGRVEGDLAVSRGLGDFRFKNMDVVMAAQNSCTVEDSASDDASSRLMVGMVSKPGDQKVSPIPDIIVQYRNAEQDAFIILACDGIWDVQTNYEGIKTVAELFAEGEADIGLICEEVCVVCCSYCYLLEHSVRVSWSNFCIPFFCLGPGRLSPNG